MNSPIASQEEDDCSVIALSVCLGITYEKAHKIMTAYGRFKGQGMYYDNLKPALERTGFKLRTDIFNLSLKRTLEKCGAHGYFYLITRNHALALLDGVVLDCINTPMSARIVRVYELQSKASLLQK